MAQKLAWAKAHGVTPPAFVVEAAAREDAKSTAPNGDEHKPRCPHCRKKAAVVKPATATQDSQQAKGVILLKALECQGHGPLGLLAATPALIPPRVVFVPPEIRVLEYVVYPLVAFHSFFVDVPVPPPRG